MLEQIKTIYLKGGPYTEQTSLDLLPSRLNLLYGRNGSGKSTIAKCIKMLGKEDDGSGYSAETALTLSEDTVRNVYVFDEDFVSDNLRMEDEEGLNSIVMIGEQVGLDEKLKELQCQQTVLKSRQNQLSKDLDSYKDINNLNSPLRHKNDIRKKLSTNGGWADLDRQIRGNRIKSAVTSSLFDELLNLKVKDNLDTLQKRLKEKFRIYQSIQRGGNKLNEFSKNILFNDISSIKTLLDRRIEEPDLDSRDKQIIELVRSEYGSYIDHVHPIFDNKEMTVCPLCLRPMSDCDKQRLFTKIEGFFNREAETYKKELDIYMEKLRQWRPIEISDFVEEIIGKDVLNQIRKCEDKLQESYMSLLSAFEKKKNNIYGISLFGDWSGLKSNQDNYLRLFERINASIRAYNSEVENKKKLHDELIGINKTIASKKLNMEFDNYRKKVAEEQDIRSQLVKSELQIQEISNDILSIMDQMKQVNIALEFINEALSYIFFHKKRMVLKSADGKYVLKSNGRDVKPKDVSTGERNAIALCYFFAKIQQKTENGGRMMKNL